MRWGAPGGADSHASDIGHWLGMTRQEGRLWRVAPAGAAGRCTPRVLVPLRSTAWASPPTEGCKGCGRATALPPSKPSVLTPPSARGGFGGSRLRARRGDAPQGRLFRFAPLRGHRSLRGVQGVRACNGSPSVNASRCHLSYASPHNPV